MIKNILKVAFRNFLKQSGHSFLSVLGLTVSFLSAFLIMLWVGHEFSYDKFHDQAGRIFKVMSHVEADGTVQTHDAAALGINVSSIPEIAEHASVISGTRWPNELCFKPKNDADECIYLNGIYSQKSLFSILSFTILQGEKNPLAKDFSIAVSKKMANHLFNSTDVIGKTLKIDGMYEVSITAVFQDIPSNSSLHFDFVMPLHIVQKLWGNSDEAMASNFHATLIKTNTDVVSEALTKKLNEPSVLTERLKADHVSYSAFPFTHWRLKSKFENGKSIGGRIRYVTLFIVIAILIVTMAIINFINLSTARASNRSKEIGIRKVTGALRFNIILQFIGESFIIVFFAFLLAVVLTQVALPLFNSLIGETISVQLLTGWNPAYLLLSLIIVSIVASLYPAFVMSSFQAAKVLKGQIATRNSGANHLRKILLLTQLSVSTGIIIFSGVLFNQLDFIVHKDLGQDRENMVRIEPTYRLFKQFDAFKNELLANPNVKSITAATNNPLSLGGANTGVKWSGMKDNTRVSFQTFGCTYEFPETFGLKIIEGRSFLPKAIDTVNLEVLVTEQAVKVMGLAEPLGERIFIGDTPCVIVGVVNDFHTQSLHQEKLPVILYPQSVLSCSAIYVKYQPGSTHQAMEVIQQVYKKMEPTYTIKYWFQDDTFNAMYKTEIMASKMVMLFTLISLIIAIIGVIGLATYNVIRKKKEIGIKRVFGATISNILTMLTKEFIFIILLSALLAIPFAWYSTNQWLSSFAYRIDMPWWIYMATFGGVILLITFIVGVQGFKAASSNPTQTLRSE